MCNDSEYLMIDKVVLGIDIDLIINFFLINEFGENLEIHQETSNKSLPASFQIALLDGSIPMMLVSEVHNFY